MVNSSLHIQALVLAGIYLLPKVKSALEQNKVINKDDFWNNVSVEKTKRHDLSQ